MVNYVGEYRGKAQAIYHLEDVNDSSGNGYNLTNRNTVGFSAGKFANAAIFGNTNSTKYLDIANNLGIDNYKAGIFTISSWIYCQTNPASGAALAIWGVNNNTKEQTNFDYLNDGGTYKFQFTFYNGSTAEFLKWTYSLTLDTWTFVTLVKNGTTLTIYVKGVSIGNQTQTIADGSPGRANQFCIGRYVYDATPFWKGNIDELAVFLYAKTPSEIRKDYAWATGRLI
jgi:hypothetical protein